MVALEGLSEVAAAGHDGCPPGRPPLVQAGVDSDHLTDRALPETGRIKRLTCAV
jgi:hypothetical protein